MCTNLVESQLTSEEKQRNTLKDAIMFEYSTDPQHLHTHYSTLPNFFDVKVYYLILLHSFLHIFLSIRLFI